MNSNGKMSLNGIWLLRWADGQRGGFNHHASMATDLARWMEAEVPGEVHLDLMRQGIIRDPYTGTGCLQARWVEECYWSYRKSFTPPPEALHGSAWLYFEGLDYNASLFLNGEEVGRHGNCFYPCRIDVTGKLLEGENVLVVRLESGLFGASDKSVQGYMNLEVDSLLHKRVWLRKPQCSFGWDWSTRLLNVGIYKPVSLEWAECVRLDGVTVESTVNESLDQGLVRVRAFAEGLTDRGQLACITVEVVEAGVRIEREVNIGHGSNVIEEFLRVESPELWWPVGYGKQVLYTVKVRIATDGRTIGEKTQRMGFRRVRINQDPHPESGSYFIIEVNHTPVFARGANFVPADMILARLDRARYESLVDRALEANFNMLRVWGGGIYESDDFYELCDRYGILVWQEFIFACTTYPGNDPAFIDDFKAEALYNIRRLSGHPSLIAWCGNNEQEWIHEQQETTIAYPDHVIYYKILPEMLKWEDPWRYYQPTSPMSPDKEHPNREDRGDQHPWDVGLFDDVDFYKYRDKICRFPNEGGTLGSTSLKAMKASLSEGQEFVKSFSWQVHDNGVEQWYENSLPDRIVKEFTGLDPLKMPVEEYTYWGGLLQGEGLKEYIDNFRRRKFDCASAIFWMFNDCWPATRSWTIVDYYLNRTPSFHPVRRAFAPVSAVVVRDGGMVRVYGVNDTLNGWSGELTYGLFRLSGEYLMKRHSPVDIGSNASQCLAEFEAGKWDLAGFDEVIAFAALTTGGETVSRNRLFLPKFVDMKWPAAKVEVARDGKHAVFSSSSYVWGVCIDLYGEERLPDNFFDLWPGMEYRIPWEESRPLPRILYTGNLGG